jgi:transposase
MILCKLWVLAPKYGNSAWQIPGWAQHGSMTATEIKILFRAGQITAEQLLDIIERQEQIILHLQAELKRFKTTLEQYQRELERLTARLAQYEPEVQNERRGGPPAFPSPARYSLAAEEKRRRRGRKKKKSPGRRRTDLKFAEAEVIKDIYPAGAAKAECDLIRQRAVWRLRHGRAVLVGYRVYRAPGKPEPRIPGVTWRCEYGIEILVVLAYLVYIIGISLDKACQVLQFFCQLALSKSQADALLRQLARHWDLEFETLCDLLAEAAVVYLDETSWKVGQEHCSLWTFASQCQRVFLFGCRKDSDTLEQMLPADVFDGIAVSDDAAVYRHRFVKAQKCWAHLLRKAIRLALLYPRRKKYQRFLDNLLQLYQDAKRAAADKRLSLEGRQRRVSELEGRLCDLCQPHWQQTPDMKPHEKEFANLSNELLERMMDEELFTFVAHPEVEPTNNRSERLLRGAAQDRKLGRTNKTWTGARRRSVIVSVFESLRACLPQFTLQSVLDEVCRWMKGGISLFDRQWQERCAAPNKPSFDTG